MNEKVKVVGMACDHAGYEMKQALADYLRNAGYEVKDFGTNSTASCDYPDYAHPLGKAVNDGTVDFGVSVCGSGNGISMVLNKYPKVRAALCWCDEIAKLARQHNDANIISMPGRFVSIDQAKEMLHTFMTTEFEGGRHQRRIDKIPM